MAQPHRNLDFNRNFPVDWDELAEPGTREREILELRFGLADGRDCTLEEVAERFDLTRERIRQIETKAIRRLRHPTRSRKLRDYLR